MNLEDRFAEGLRRLVAAHPVLQIEMDWETVIPIIANLQLALRHPGNRGESAAIARRFVDGIIARIAEVEPDLAELLRMGDDPQHDVDSKRAKT